MRGLGADVAGFCAPLSATLDEGALAAKSAVVTVDIGRRFDEGGTANGFGYHPPMRAAFCFVAVTLAACGPDVITPLQMIDGEFAPPRDRGPPLDESVPVLDGAGAGDAAGDGAAGDAAAGDGAAGDGATCGDAEASVDAECTGDGAA